MYKPAAEKAMDYKQEINRMKKHREKFLPALNEVLANHMDIRRSGTPAEISESPYIFIILELIDIEMLDPEAFVVTMQRSSIETVYQNGLYPLTAAGESFMQENFNAKKKMLQKSVIIITICILFFLLIWRIM